MIQQVTDEMKIIPKVQFIYLIRFLIVACYICHAKSRKKKNLNASIDYLCMPELKASNTCYIFLTM